MARCSIPRPRRSSENHSHARLVRRRRRSIPSTCDLAAIWFLSVPICHLCRDPRPPTCGLTPPPRNPGARQGDAALWVARRGTRACPASRRSSGTLNRGGTPLSFYMVAAPLDPLHRLRRRRGTRSPPSCSFPGHAPPNFCPSSS